MKENPSENNSLTRALLLSALLAGCTPGTQNYVEENDQNPPAGTIDGEKLLSEFLETKKEQDRANARASRIKLQKIIEQHLKKSDAGVKDNGPKMIVRTNDAGVMELDFTGK